MTPKEMALTAAKALDEKKGGDIAAIEITEQTTLAGLFRHCHRQFQHPDQRPVRRSGEGHEGAGGGGSSPPGGLPDGTWVLLDYGCVVVHVFSAEAREFYSLERLWHDGKPVDLSGVLTEN